MTVKELIRVLGQFDGDATVVFGEVDGRDAKGNPLIVKAGDEVGFAHEGVDDSGDFVALT